MLVALTALAVLAAEPRGELHLALGPLAVSELGDERGAAFVEYFVQRLRREGLRITTQRDLAASLGAARQKQLLGCSQDADSCLSEIAGALGADGVITGSVGRVGSELLCTVKVVDSSAHVVATASVSAPDEPRLLDSLDRASATLVEQLRRRYGARVASDRRTSRLWALVPAGAFVASAVAGVVLNLQARGINDALAANPTGVADEKTLNAQLDQGYRLQAISWALVSIAVAAALTSLVLALVLGDPS